MNQAIVGQIENILDSRILNADSLCGGCVGQVLCVELADGRRVVAKIGQDSQGSLAIEGAMLDYLSQRSSLPVPQVIHTSPNLLIMQLVPGTSRFSLKAERHAADLLADLHENTSESFGFDFDTLIGGLPQPNPRHTSWPEFFAENRLRFMATQALDAGRLPRTIHDRVFRLADDISQFIRADTAPGLIHGDIWSGNVLADGDQVTGFIDPAIYYADPEIELAFITLFNCFGSAFFDRYSDRRPIANGFFETRRDLYNLYPLLVHVRLFGGSYVDSVKRTLEKFGYAG